MNAADRKDRAKPREYLQTEKAALSPENKLQTKKTALSPEDPRPTATVKIETKQSQMTEGREYAKIRHV